MDNLIGCFLGQYKIIEKIGRGGTAYVFKAFQPSLERYVAIKVLSPVVADEPDFTESFQREALTIARLNHPHILAVHDSGVQGVYHYLVMRYVPDSISLAQLLVRPTPPLQLIEYVIQVADALHYAHEQGLIHRDVKPANILIDGRWALLSDFGLVKDSHNPADPTGPALGLGTPAYMSPEQARGQTVDCRSDIYTLGIILYQILTGHTPHQAEAPLAVIHKRATEPVPLFQISQPGLSPRLAAITMQAMAMDPAQRYVSAAALAADLAAIIK